MISSTITVVTYNISFPAPMSLGLIIGITIGATVPLLVALFVIVVLVRVICCISDEGSKSQIGQFISIKSVQFIVSFIYRKQLFSQCGIPGPSTVRHY